MNNQSWFAQEDLRVRLLTQDSGSFQGVVVEAEDRSDGPMLIADFPRASAPSLPIGSEVPLQFTGPSLSGDLGGNGTIVLRSEDFFRQRYAFQISREAVLPLAQAIQQRHAVRVQPSSASPVQVQLSTIDGANRCEPIPFDVSATGISLRIPSSDERRFFDAWEVKVTLTLADQDKAISFFGTVRSRRRLEGSTVLYGVEFDPAKTPDFAEKQDEILQYVSSVQAENFRRARANDQGQTEQPVKQATPAKKAQPVAAAAGPKASGPVRMQKSDDSQSDGKSKG